MPTRTATPPDRSARRERRGGRWSGPVPPVVVALAVFAPGFLVSLSAQTGLFNVIQLLGVVIGLALIAWFASRPGLVVRALVWILPVQLVLLSCVYGLIHQGSITRMLGLWKDAGIAGLVLAVAIALREHRRALDALDRLCLGFTALSLVYLASPAWLLGPLGGAVSLDSRFSAWRGAMLPVLLVFIGRHLRVEAEVVRRVSRAFMTWGAVFGGLAVVELVAGGWWNTFMVDVIGINRFRFEALELPRSTFTLGLDEVRVVSPTGLTRVGGLFVAPLQLSFFLLVCFAFLLERVVQGRSPMSIRIGLALTAAGILLAQTRSVILGALIVGLAATLPGAGRDALARRRFAVLLVAAALAAVPLLGAAGYAGRFFGGDQISDSAHAASHHLGWTVLGHHLLGQGIGLGVNGVSLGVSGAIVSENQLVDVGLQIGVLGMVLFAAVLLVLIVRLSRAATSVADHDLQLGAAAIRSALLGLLVPCWFLQPFAEVQMGWLVPLAAGLALGAVERRASEPDPAGPGWDPPAVRRR